MADATLSIFVDESGRFQIPDKESPYYIVAMVMHDQRVSIAELVTELEWHFSEMRLSNVCFHAGPLIRQKNASQSWTGRFATRYSAECLRLQANLISGITA